MNLSFPHSLPRALAYAILVAVPSVSLAADSPATRRQPIAASPPSPDLLDGTLRVASERDVENDVRTFSGRQLRNKKGESLGTIEDCAIDAHSGRLAYAVVSSGESRPALRLVPFAALQDAGGSGDLTVEIERAQWEQSNPIKAEDFERGRIALGPAERRQLSDRFGQTDPAPIDASSSAAVSRPDPGAETSGTHVLRASQLRGKRVSTGPDALGTIAAIVIDTKRRTTAALLNPERDVARAGKRFIVPLRQLNLAATELDPVQTTLSRADFQAAERVAQSDRAPVQNDEPPLSPTGRLDRESDAGAPTATRIAAIVQQALANAGSPSSGSVSVVMEDGKVVLKGAVRSQTVKDNVERAVREALSAAKIDNQIEVAK